MDHVESCGTNMPDFQGMFTAAQGQAVEYDGRLIHMADRLPIGKTQTIDVTFEAVNSDWRQGVHLSTVGSFDVDGQKIKSALVLWQDTAPRDARIVVHSKNGICLVKNVWDIGDGVMHSWHSGGAMQISDVGERRIYECNDGRNDDDFDDLVFSINLTE